MTQNTKISIFIFFCNFVKKTSIVFFAFLCFFAFCVIISEPIDIKTCLAPKNDRLNLSFVKDVHTISKKWPKMVVKRPFISCNFLGRVSDLAKMAIGLLLHFMP